MVQEQVDRHIFHRGSGPVQIRIYDGPCQRDRRSPDRI